LPEGWTVVRLGDVLTRSDERLGKAPEPDILTCTEGDGLILQMDKFSRRVASEDTSKYKTVRPFDIVFNPYLLWLGAIGQSKRDALAITSPVYEVFRPVDSLIDPGFAGLSLCDISMRSAYDSISIGSIPRRRRATAERFVELEVTIPPLRQQRRIVDLLHHLSSLDDALSKSLAAHLSALRSVVVRLIESVRGDTVPVHALFELVIGGVWGASEGERAAPVRALGTSIFRNGVFELDASNATPRSLSEKQLERRWIREGDIILERSGGGPNQPVGRVVIAPSDMPGVVPTDFMRLLRPRSGVVEPWFAYWVLWALYQTGVTQAHQRQTTAIRNLTVRSYLETTCVLPPVGEQRHVCDVAEAVRTAAESHRAPLEAVRKAADAIRSELLADEFRMPNTYDAFLHRTAAA
jgi:restriction endonuclease S subunit